MANLRIVNWRLKIEDWRFEVFNHYIFQLLKKIFNIFLEALKKNRGQIWSGPDSGLWHWNLVDHGLIYIYWKLNYINRYHRFRVQGSRFRVQARQKRTTKSTHCRQVPKGKESSGLSLKEFGRWKQPHAQSSVLSTHHFFNLKERSDSMNLWTLNPEPWTL